jgi:hypothetical protein
VPAAASVIVDGCSPGRVARVLAFSELLHGKSQGLGLRLRAPRPRAARLRQHPGAVGIALLAVGHLGGLLPTVLILLALITLLVSVNVVGMRSLEQAIPNLIQEVNGVLGSTATFPGRPPFGVPMATAHKRSNPLSPCLGGWPPP